MSGFRIRVCGSGNRLDSFFVFLAAEALLLHILRKLLKSRVHALDEHRGLLFTRKYVMKRFVLT